MGDVQPKYSLQGEQRRTATNGPWRSLDEVEFATLEWVDWFNNRRLLEPIEYIPPAELEAALWIERHVLPHRVGRAPMFVNSTRGTRWSARALRAWWGRARDEVGVPRGRFYEDTKHTFGTDLARKKVPERLQQAWMGRSSVASTRRYAQLADEALLDVLTLARPQPLVDFITARNQKVKSPRFR